MRNFTSNEIREMWFNFFKLKNHKIMESEPLIPIDDNSLLFINAGVATMKKYFDGSIVPDNKRIASIQKCIRTNDIENVGLTKRHLTFFEMLVEVFSLSIESSLRIFIFHLEISG